MTPAIDMDNEQRRAPDLYLQSLPPEFIRPAELAELKVRAEKAGSENIELRQKLKDAQNTIFALRMQMARDGEL
jgi:hypothetical protein